MSTKNEEQVEKYDAPSVKDLCSHLSPTQIAMVIRMLECNAGDTPATGTDHLALRDFIQAVGENQHSAEDLDKAYASVKELILE